MARYRTLNVQDEGDLLRITMARPERQNSIDAAMLADLHAALDQAAASPDCHLLVLRGGNGVFCTGMDFADASRADAGPDLAERGGEAFYALLERMTTLPLPIIAQVDGRVAAGGIGIAAACDLVHATPRSTFALPEALWGILPCCVLPFLIRRTGFQPAYAMALSTLPVSADRAYQAHLVDELTDDLELTLSRLRSRLTKIDPKTVGHLKRYQQQLWIISERSRHEATTEFTRLMSDEVVRERIAAFAQHQRFPWEKPGQAGAASRP